MVQAQGAGAMRSKSSNDKVSPSQARSKAVAASGPSHPPSLNRVAGQSDSEFQEQELLQRLEKVIRRLPLRIGAERYVRDGARRISEVFLMALGDAVSRRKTR